jgi:hypothetical protein
VWESIVGYQFTVVLFLRIVSYAELRGYCVLSIDILDPTYGLGFLCLGLHVLLVT